MCIADLAKRPLGLHSSGIGFFLSGIQYFVKFLSSKMFVIIPYFIKSYSLFIAKNVYQIDKNVVKNYTFLHEKYAGAYLFQI